MQPTVALYGTSFLSLSGGKDSTALAIYLRDRIPELEYVFCDTGKELPETYEYIDRLEVYLELIQTFVIKGDSASWEKKLSKGEIP